MLSLPCVNDFQELLDEVLVQAIHQIVVTEGPIHLTPLTTRLVHGAGLTRSGARTQRPDGLSFWLTSSYKRLSPSPSKTLTP